MSTPESPEQLALQSVVAGRYSIIKEIGRGGMGVVFLATDVVLERRVAIKLLLPHLARDETLRARFLREARTAAQLMHPNIVPLHTVEAHDEVLFFVMSYVDGETLTQRVQRRGRLSSDEAVRLVQELAWALSYAHAQGVVHRDIKPDNILLERGSGRALITDFGIARVAATETLSEQGAFVGTLQYMSPEQALGELVDGRSDLYSLGATAFYAVTSQPPIEGPTLPALLSRLQNDAPPSVATFRSDLPAVLVDAIGRCLRKTAVERFGKSEEIALALRDTGGETAPVPVEIRMLIRELGVVALILALGVAAMITIPILILNGEIARADAPSALIVALLFPLIGLMGVTGLVLQAVRKGIPLEDFDAPLKAEADRAVAERNAYLDRAWDARAVRVGRWMAIGSSVAGIGVSVSWLMKERVLFASNPVLLWSFPAVMMALTIWSLFTLRYFKPGVRPPQWYVTGGFPVALPLRVLRWVLKTRLAKRLFSPALSRAQKAAAKRASAIPTATLLVRRVEELLEGLPPLVRGRLGDVGAVASRVEAAINALRERVARLDAAMAEVGPQHESHAVFAAARTLAAERLSSATTALETLRADLLRLQAGLVGVEGITADLERVRELGASVDAELFGLDSVRQMRRGGTTAPSV